MSLYGYCDCETCLGQDQPEPHGNYECGDCGEPVQDSENYDVDRDSDGDLRFFHAQCPNGEGPANEPGAREMAERIENIEQVVEAIAPRIKIIEIGERVSE